MSPSAAYAAYAEQGGGVLQQIERLFRLPHPLSLVDQGHLGNHISRLENAVPTLTTISQDPSTVDDTRRSVSDILAG